MQPDLVFAIRKKIHAVIMVFTWIAAATLCFMVAVIVVNVFGRYLFRIPLQGTVELVELALVVTAVLSFSYTEIVDGHVTMDELVARFPQRARKISKMIMYFASAVFFFIMSWRSAYLAVSHATPEVRVTDVLKIPIAPLIFVVSVGAAIFGLALLLNGVSLLFLEEEEKGEDK